jgi:hypothetical protein
MLQSPVPAGSILPGDRIRVSASKGAGRERNFRPRDSNVKGRVLGKHHARTLLQNGTTSPRAQFHRSAFDRPSGRRASLIRSFFEHNHPHGLLLTPEMEGWKNGAR